MINPISFISNLCGVCILLLAFNSCDNSQINPDLEEHYIKWQIADQNFEPVHHFDDRDEHIEYFVAVHRVRDGGGGPDIVYGDIAGFMEEKTYDKVMVLFYIDEELEQKTYSEGLWVTASFVCDDAPHDYGIGESKVNVRIEKLTDNYISGTFEVKLLEKVRGICGPDSSTLIGEFKNLKIER